MTFSIWSVIGTVLVALSTWLIWRIQHHPARRRERLLRELEGLKDDMGAGLADIDLERITRVLHQLRELGKAQARHSSRNGRAHPS